MGNENCKKCPPAVDANIENMLTQIMDNINELNVLTKFLKCGNPILALQQEKDVDSFGSDGYGTECWEGWVVCNGTTYVNSKNKNIATPNFTNRTLVQAGGAYNVDDTFGSDNHTLTTAEMPVHNHGVNDNGHDHNVNDTGHSHTVTDGGHTHAQNPHTHSYSDTLGDQPGGWLEEAPDPQGTYNAVNRTISRTTDSTTAVNQSATTGVSVNSSTTGVGVVEATTGITIQNAGEGEPHENRQPSYAVLYVMYIG